MENTACPECLASWLAGQTCQDHFHQMLFWEAEDPANGIVHHLTILCYHLQHPSLYSPDGLQYAMRLLVDFVENGISTQQVRREKRDQVNSGNRMWKVTSRPGSQGAYPHPVQWRMTAGDVVAGGIDDYIQNVQAWAKTVLEDLQRCANLPQ